MSRQPIRTCVACGGRFEKSELMRYVWRDCGPVTDPAQKLNGRGAYCCRTEKCSDRFYRTGAKWKRIFRLL